MLEREQQDEEEEEGENFNLATNYIQSHHQEFNKEQLLKFYGFYKQATVGPLDPQKNLKPSFFNFNDRAKWEAWHALGAEVTEAVARREYIKLLSDLKPEWHDQNSSSGDSSEKSKQSFGVSVSRMRVDDDDDAIDEADKTIEDFIKEGNVEKFKELLSSIGDVNEIDEDSGLALIHWICDRGNESILELILSQKEINIDLRDREGQTALHYASSCGHKSCINLLLSHGANRDILDNDGSSCVEAAFDEEIKALLC